MSSSTFEVKESESDTEKAIDFGIDTCEENGIASSQVDGDVPKDHTYNKEPDILKFVFQDEELKENEDSNNQLDENSMEISDPPTEKPKAVKSTKAEKSVKKPPARGKTKKNPPKKESSAPKKGRSKKDDVIADIAAVTEDLAKENEEDNAVAEDINDAAVEEQPKPAKRGRKRKNEEKENEPSQDSESEEPAANTEEPLEKKSTTAKATKSTPAKGKKASPTEGVTESHNMPKGWVKKTVVRQSGKSAGKVDIYIYSPDGFKFRSKPEVISFLKRTNSSLKIDDFDFSKNVSENETVKAALTAKKPKKKSAPVKSKSPATKKKVPASPKKTPKLLVKIVSDRKKKIEKKSTEKSAKTSKTPAKGKKTTAKAVAKGSKKKKA